MTTTDANRPMLEVENVSTSFFTQRGVVQALRDASFSVARGEMFGIVGETGAGKTVLMQSIMNQVRFPGKITQGRVLLEGRNLLGLSNGELRAVRGTKLAFIASNPRTALDPLATIGKQLTRALLAHADIPKHEADVRVLEALESVRLPDARRRAKAYPHELSVGMAQRVLIALALLHSPELVIADEPTTGLDVTVQREVLTLMKSLIDDLGSSAVIVTHDLGVVAHFCDRLGVMHDGEIVEKATVTDFFTRPRHEYSRLLVASSQPAQPAGDRAVAVAEGAQAARERAQRPVVLEVRDLVKHYAIRERKLPRLARAAPKLAVQAVNGISFDVREGESLGLVGESGSGKTTIGRLVLGLVSPTSGEIVVQGREITSLRERELRSMRAQMQMVFQEPHASLNPTMTIARNIAEPLILQRGIELSKADRAERVRELLDQVHLPARVYDLYPHHLSSGQAQRAGIARGIATSPRLLVLDEPTSRLDYSVRAAALELLNEIRERHGMSYIFISHDLSAVQSVCDRIAVMYLGKIVEIGSVREVVELRRHPYTRALLTSVLDADPDTKQFGEFALSGEIPSPVDYPVGCVLHGRCPLAGPDCRGVHPALEERAPESLVACYRDDEILAQAAAVRSVSGDEDVATPATGR